MSRGADGGDAVRRVEPGDVRVEGAPDADVIDADVAIIGAGVVGCAVARELARFRVRVLLLEASDDVGTGATKANSGIVHGAHSSPHGTLKSALCAAGNRMYRRLDEELRFGWRRTGALVLAFSPREEEGLRALYGNGLRAGDRDLELLDGARARALEPALGGGVTAALLAPSVGVASPYELAIALAENAVENGVQLRLSAPVTAIRRHAGGGGFTLVAGGEALRVRFVVNAAGVHAAEVAALAGEPGFRIIPRQGQYLLFQRGSGPVVGRVIFQAPSPAGKGVLVTSTYHGNLMIGPNANEVADPRDTGTTQDGLRQIVRAARRSVPGFDLQRVITTFAGVRATPDTGDFVIGGGPAPGFFNAAGIDSPGLTAAPAIAERVRDLLADAGLELAAAPAFRPFRPPIIVPRSLPAAEVARLLEAGGPQRIVCRCEQVSEGEILDALRRAVPARSIDALKRRTRAGMGLCQGAFCRPRVAALIERETGIPAAETVRRYEEHQAAKRRVRLRLVRLLEEGEEQ